MAAEDGRIFCVRSDDGTRGKAWTPATGRHGTVLATLDTLADVIGAQQVRPPAIIVIGEVVAVDHPERFARG